MGSSGGHEGGGELMVGVAVRPLAALVSSLRELLAELDPAQLPARDAAELVQVCDQLSRVADAGKTLAAGRVAESSLWSRGGHKTAAHWMAKVCGITVGDAVRMLDLAETVAEAPATKDALLAGKVSGRQADAVGKAEKADPAAGRRLVESAPGRTLNDVQNDARRIMAAASSESPEETAERHRKARRFRHGVNDDGMGWGSWLLPIAEHTRAVAMIDAEQAVVFDAKRVAGEREPAEAYAADGLCRVLDRASLRGSGSPAPAAGDSGDTVVEDWSFAKIIVNVDLFALDRGHVQAGERCEIAGQGPVPVDDVFRMIDGEAFVAAVATRGTEISKVVHLGRRPTALQRTALEHRNGAVCSIDGCASTARLEIDHVAEWAATKRTELNELAFVCGHHHDLKTHHGHRFGPLRPDGTRRLIPPDHATGPPDATGPPHLALHDGECASGAPPGGEPADAPRQGDLFDTG